MRRLCAIGTVLLVLVLVPGTGRARAPSPAASASRADIVLRQSARPRAATVGERVALTLTIHNRGPGPARAVRLVDPLPDSVDGRVTLELLVPRTSCLRDPTSNTVTCAFGRRTPGSNASVRIIVTPEAPGALTNRAVAMTASEDLATGNNWSKISVRVSP